MAPGKAEEEKQRSLEGPATQMAACGGLPWLAPGVVLIGHAPPRPDSRQVALFGGGLISRRCWRWRLVFAFTACRRHDHRDQHGIILAMQNRLDALGQSHIALNQIGRASCRERV